MRLQTKTFRPWALALIVASILIVPALNHHFAQAATAVSVDFSKPTQTLSPIAFGMDESGYPGGGPVLADSAAEQQAFKTLGVKAVRMALKYTVSHDPTSKIVCSGSGCDLTPSGDQFV